MFYLKPQAAIFHFIYSHKKTDIALSLPVLVLNLDKTAVKIIALIQSLFLVLHVLAEGPCPGYGREKCFSHRYPELPL